MTRAAPSVVLVGPTASGKSALAHGIALASDGAIEILSVDAMSVYREMDMGTAKPTKEEQREVRYHLLDLVDPSEEFTVAEFQRAARIAADEIASRGHAALYVGGTGLYGRAVIDNLDIPAQYSEVRSELEDRARDGIEPLFEQLTELDPLAASRTEPNNDRRILRALEVTLGSGRPFSSYGEGLTTYGPVRIVQVGLECDTAVLNERIERRFRQWMDDGFLDEVVRLSKRPRGLSKTARQAVGYRELLRHVEDGADLHQCVEEAIAASRRLGRRQRAWFRRDPRVEWFRDPLHAGNRVSAVLNDFPTGVED